MYGKDGEKMIPPVRIHGRKWDVEEWSMFKEIRDERAFNGILNQIIENIQNGSLKAGDALPAERTMAEIMGVSRPAVREALRALELLGIVKPVPGGGNYITEDLDTWLIEPLSILFKLNNGYHLNITDAEILREHKGSVYVFMSPNDLSILENELKAEMEKLLEIKKITPEVGTIPKIQKFHDYIEKTLSEIKEAAETAEEKTKEWKKLNQMFLKMISVNGIV